MMKGKTTKVRMYLTIDREEVFLNDMIAQGWKPVKITLGMFFHFQRCEPNEYIARVTSAIDPNGSKASKEKRKVMVEYLTDSGAEVIPETNVDAGTRIYAVRHAALGDFQINTDTDSLIADYRARRSYQICGAIFAAVMCAMAIFLGLNMLWKNVAGVSSNIYQINIAGACVEFFAAALLFVCFTAFVIPIPTYSSKIKELREKREIEE